MYYECYKKGSKSDYKGFKEVVKTCFNSVKAENDKEKDLKNIILTLLNKALRHKQKRLNFEKLVSIMKQFEEENKYKIKCSKKEHKHDKELLNLYMLSDKANSLNNKENEVESNEKKNK